MRLDPVPRWAALAAPLLAFARPARAQWPNRPVALVVPFPAGGTADLVARLLAPELSRAFGRPFVVDNRPGANGTLDTDAVVRARPDGHTLLLGASPTHTDEAGLVEHVRARIASYKKPRSVAFVPELPRLPQRKVDKKALRRALAGSWQAARLTPLPRTAGRSHIRL